MCWAGEHSTGICTVLFGQVIRQRKVVSHIISAGRLGMFSKGVRPRDGLCDTVRFGTVRIVES
jgi:hypothetical protein